MNYRQRDSYARQSSNDNLKVQSPRALQGKATEHMYLPRNDKFEGYSQFPRPRIPPENQKIDSFIGRRPKGEIYVERDPDMIPIKELLEKQAQRKEHKMKLTKQTEEFLTGNIGFLTGTHTGANNGVHSKVSHSQVREELAAPKIHRPRGARQQLLANNNSREVAANSAAPIRQKVPQKSSRN